MLACSYVIPVYNAEKYISMAIKSVLNKNFLPSDEIVIVNDCSTDNSLQVMKTLIEKQPESIRNRIRIIDHEKNKGSAAASRNTAITHSTNETIFCLDADNVLPKGGAIRIRSYLEESGLDVCSPEKIVFFTGDLHVTHQWIFEERLIKFEDVLSCHFWPGPSGNYLFTRNYFDRIGPYPEEFGKAYDSWAYGFIQVAEGGKFGICPASHYLHRWGLNDSAFVLGASDPSFVLLPLMMRYSKLLIPEVQRVLSTEEFKKNWFKKIGTNYFYPGHTSEFGVNEKFSFASRILKTLKVRLFEAK
ncbi:hypothetical protein BH09BAC3_BH09BAC3_13130 [soil metagenome]